METRDPPLAEAMRRLEDAFGANPSPLAGEVAAERPEGGRANMQAPDAVARPPPPAPSPQGGGGRTIPSPDAIRAAEALLFAGGEPITAKALSEKLGPAVDVAAVLMKLKADYAERGVQLVEAGGGWRFQSAPDLAGLFAENREAPRKLPKAALETLAVIAYHQPVTRAEIEEIRGVSLSRGSMELLLEIGWIRPRGRRRSPGRPLTFGTTDAFLGHFGLASLDALPGKDDLKALGLIDPRAAAQLDVPRPSEETAPDEEKLSDGDDAASFFVDHMGED